jgi:hypothetical protein
MLELIISNNVVFPYRKLSKSRCKHTYLSLNWDCTTLNVVIYSLATVCWDLAVSQSSSDIGVGDSNVTVWNSRLTGYRPGSHISYFLHSDVMFWCSFSKTTSSTFSRLSFPLWHIHPFFAAWHYVGAVTSLISRSSDFCSMTFIVLGTYDWIWTATILSTSHLERLQRKLWGH